MRCIRFLMDQLRIVPEHMPRQSQSPYTSDAVGDEQIWTLLGFMTGQVIDGTCPSNQVVSSPPTYPESSMDLSLRRTLSDMEPERLSETLRELGEVDMSRLRFGLSFLRAVSQRNWPSNNSNYIDSYSIEDILHTETSRVTVFTSSCAEKELLVGVGYGRVRKGNVVVHFLGHEVAFTVDTARRDQPRLTGFLVCSRAHSSMEAGDLITQQTTQFYTIQSEAECDQSVGRINLLLSSSEMLLLAQRISSNTGPS